MTYADNTAWQKLPEPLYDSELHLVGKPDYVVRLKNGVQVPVEVKSAQAPEQPYQAHILQLAAYCRLLDKLEGQRPPYGLIHYRDKTFQVDYSPELEQMLYDTLQRIDLAERAEETPARSHHQAARCRGCGYKGLCEERLS